MKLKWDFAKDCAMKINTATPDIISWLVADQEPACLLADGEQ